MLPLYCFSRNTTGKYVLPVPPVFLGPPTKDAHSYLNALSVAFFETYLLNRPEYQVYLQPAYAKYISKAPLNLSFLQSLRAEQLTPFVNGRKKSVKSSKPQSIPAQNRK